ncbi:HNH endonuclease [Achromobacter arsenitoxydans]|uniref:HNH endonuclease n=1 Tax=Achromobacter arsenitoxydans TaxID=1147684 RepID=UPI00111208D7|nr:hypothetical protein [Achromobacter arsenitoxydans]
MSKTKKSSSTRGNTRKTANRYGLSRTIPSETKREVRQRCGFGCVVCGNAIVEYEHFEPEFKDAKKHDATGIILLCTACHGRKTRRLLSKETIREHIAAPASREQGFASDVFDTNGEHPRVTLGDIEAFEVETLLKIEGERVLWVEPPEQPGSPFRLNAHFKTKGGSTLFQITDNEWKAPSDNWDVQMEANRITIRAARGEIALVLRTVPPDALHVERLVCEHRGWKIEAHLGRAVIFSKGDQVFTTNGMVLERVDTAVEVSSNQFVIGFSGRKSNSSVQMRSLKIGAPDGRMPRPHGQSYLSSESPPDNPFESGRAEAFQRQELDAPCECGSGSAYGLCHYGNDVRKGLKSSN